MRFHRHVWLLTPYRGRGSAQLKGGKVTTFWRCEKCGATKEVYEHRSPH